MTLAVARLAGAAQGEPGREVEAGRLSGARVPGEDWQIVGDGYRATDGPAVNARGEMFFTDPPNNRIHKVGLDGKVDGVCREHERRQRHDVRPGRPALCRRDAHEADRRVRRGGQDRGGGRERGGQRSRDQRQGRSLLHGLAGRRRSGCCQRAARRASSTRGSTSRTACCSRRIRRCSTSRTTSASCRGCSRFSRTARWRTSSDTSTSTCRMRRRAARPTAWPSIRTAASTSRPRSACRSSIRSASATRSSRRRSARPLSNVEFGGPNMDEMYVTNGDKVFKRKTKVKGVRVVASADQAGAAAVVSQASALLVPGTARFPILQPRRADCCVVRNRTLVCIANYCQLSTAYDIWRSQSLSEHSLTTRITRADITVSRSRFVEEEDR